jgi:predicted amidohydrolase YtcJ
VYGPSQRLTPEEALATYTIGSAYLQFQEGDRGSIAVGKRADLVLLSADPTKVEPEAISDIVVHKTIIGGVVVYDNAMQGADRFTW